ncbi:MAG: PD-(D/E)XK nuclease family protein [Gallionella sp.]
MEQLKSSGPQLAAAVFFETGVRSILAQNAPPDLRGATVLLPSYHVASPLARALGEVSQSTLLLPNMVTLGDWALDVVLDVPVIADSQRGALLYQQLRRQRWFGQADLWLMTRELLALFDELTHSLTVLPDNPEAFAAAVEQAYQARQNSTLQLEARLVFELWYAMQSGSELDAARAYQLRLAKLAARAQQPLFVLRTSGWNALEQRFLDDYAGRAAVTVFDLREEMEISPRAQFIRAAMTADDARDLRTIAAQLQRTPPPGDTLRFFAATSLEQEARAAAMQVRRWLGAGKRDIAVVAQDRVVARRLRALLERAEVLVADETGWTFATLSVSTVLMRWLDALQSDFYHHDLLDLLKSPFIFADLPAAGRKAAVYRLEQLLRRQGVVAGLEKFAALAADETVLQQPLARLRQAAALLGQNTQKTLAGWLAALHESMRVLAIDAGLQTDDAGVRLLQALDDWRQELAADDGQYRFAEWRRWLARQLDAQTYHDTGIESPVRFTHLAATRCRVFDAVLLLGCDADHLPGVAAGGRWFNDAVRASLDLPTLGTHAARQRDDLLALLTLNESVLVTWQKDRNGEQGLLSPYLEMVRDLHGLAYGDNLSECELHHYLAAEDAHRVELPPASRPGPAVPAETVPETVSISAYNSLVACPYQFYARHILHLNELDEVQEAIEKRDYGERVHDILSRFHERYPLVTGHPVDEMDAELREISAQVFDDLLQRDFAARAWLARWYKSLPAYLDWQLGNEAQGWRYAESESAFDWQLEGVRLRGRIDRLDTRGNEKRVLDYKTQGDQLLRNKLLEPGEDVQLACYAYAHEAADAAFVSIENGKVKLVEPRHDVPQLAQLNAERLEQVMGMIRGGAGMPANGIDQACIYCEMRGVCRKGEW